MYITEIKVDKNHWEQVGCLQSGIKEAYSVYKDLVKHNKHYKGIPYRIRKLEGENDAAHTLHSV